MDKTLSLKLVRADEEHFDRLLAIQDRSDQLEKNPIGLSRSDLIAMQSWKRMGPDGLLSLYHEKEIVGMMRYMRYLDAPVPAVAAIVTVDPDHRDEGIADWAYAHIVARAKGDGATCLDTIVDHGDRDVREFLKRRGFHELVSLWTLEADPNFAPGEKPRLPQGYKLRTYEPGKDAALVSLLHNRIFGQHKSFAPTTTADMESIENTPSFDPELTFFLESDAGEAVGYGRNAVRGDKKEAWIDMVGVVPEHQGKGFGRYLLLQCMYDLAQVRPRCIRLAVEGTNERARALYDSEGFMGIRTRIRYRKALDG
jgi:mycothiol synthase